MSKFFRYLESLRKKAGKKWSQNWTFLLRSGLKLPCNFFFVFCWFCHILRGRTGRCGAHLFTCMEPILLHVWSPFYYTRGAHKTGGGCRASIAPACSRRVDAWTPVCVDPWTRQPPPLFIYFNFFLEKSRKLSKIVLVLRSASVERFDVSRARDFWQVLQDMTLLFTYNFHILHHLQAMKMICLKLFSIHVS